MNITSLSAIAAISIAIANSIAAAPASAECMVKPAKLRFDDGFSCTATDRDPDQFFLKSIPLNQSGLVVLSMGGEVRERYEYTFNPAFGSDRQDKNGVFLQRLALHGDLQIGSRLRLFGQLYHALEDGRNGGPSPVDENRLEFQNAFADLVLLRGGDEELSARIGRQEIAFGSGRIVDVREGPNNRRNFDGGVLSLHTNTWRFDGLAARPVEQDPGAFDDETDESQVLWGLYVSGAATSFVNSNTDLYYLGFRDDAATFVQGVGTETRHSFGARLFGNRAGWDWNWEGLYQFGSFGQRSINAWTLATETGFTVDHVRGRPRFGFSFNAASGDDDPNDTELGTFNPLFPRGNYFSEAAVLGPRNFLNIQPSLSLKPTNQVTASAAVNFFWRLETGDGVYTPSGQILRTPSRSSERFVGTGLSFSTTYEVAQNLEATAIYSRLFAGDFIEASGPSGDIDFVELTVQYKF